MLEGLVGKGKKAQTKRLRDEESAKNAIKIEKATSYVIIGDYVNTNTIYTVRGV